MSALGVVIDQSFVMSDVVDSFVDLPDLVYLRIASYLVPEEAQSLSLTCKRLHAVIPSFLVIKGKDFHIYGPSGGHFAPELYFKGPPLTGAVRKLTISLTWRDQGWGNAKGDVFLTLMGRRALRSKEVVIKYLGIAPHVEETKCTVLTDDPIVTEAIEGDWYKFTRNAGGGGGHQLIVKNYKVIVEYR